jgi:hypothetical protein
MRIGCDIGRSGIKASTLTERLLGLPVIAELSGDRDVCGRGTTDRISRTNGTLYLEAWRIGYEGREWLVGERVEALGLPGRYAMTVSKADASTRLMILAAVTALSEANSVEVCVGLPHHQFDEEGQVMRDLLRGEHKVRVQGKERPVTLLGVVVPEGIGIWVRSLFRDGDSEPDRHLIPQMTVVLDFGHRTIQCCILTSLRVVRNPYVSAHGAYEVWESALMTLLEGRGGTVYESPQRAAMMTTLLREGVLAVRDRRITLEGVRPLLAGEAERIWPRVKEEISRVLEGVPFERVVAGGGGVHVYGPFLREFFQDNLVILEDRFAQAEGCRLFLEHYQTLKNA